ncbi:unnamed protein product [Schistocephalus solidus]|uniref:C2H2-type domain-containing protein n=1 Tax=Schistocephalus solidus TaxID=70667 RepID=A0A183TNY5_SCHSO|nr:unnamed protein product [Schistocephalus solidus]
MLLWTPLTGTQLSPVAHQSWVLLSILTPGNRHDRRAKPREDLRRCVCLHTRVHELLFVDESDNTVTEEDKQRSMGLFATGCSTFGLTISTAKTIVMPQPPISAEYNAPQIKVNGAQLKYMETIAYLESTLSHNTIIDDEFAQRISKTSQAFGWLQASVKNGAKCAPSDSPTLIPGINSITPTIIETTSQYSSPETPTTATTTAFAFTITTTISDGDSLLNYPQRDRKFTSRISLARNFNSRIGLVGHLRIHREVAGEPVPGDPTCSRRTRLHCPHCSRTFTHRMGLLGHMRLHDNLQ